MNLPWVSRFAFTVLEREHERVVAQNERLEEALTRLRRTEAGLREVPKGAPAPPDEMPREVRELIAGFDSGAMIDTVEREAWEARRKGIRWEEIHDRLERSVAE